MFRSSRALRTLATQRLPPIAPPTRRPLSTTTMSAPPPQPTKWDRLIRYVSARDGQVRYGEPILPANASPSPDIDALALSGQLTVTILKGATPFLAEPTGEQDSVATLLGPLTPHDVPIVRCTGLNYKAHSKQPPLIPPTPISKTPSSPRNRLRPPPEPNIIHQTQPQHQRHARARGDPGPGASAMRLRRRARDRDRQRGVQERDGGRRAHVRGGVHGEQRRLVSGLADGAGESRGAAAVEFQQVVRWVCAVGPRARESARARGWERVAVDHEREWGGEAAGDDERFVLRRGEIGQFLEYRADVAGWQRDSDGHAGGCGHGVRSAALAAGRR
nr:hypothetical protein CFP56_52791 [Quercus suber]